ncbi:MAG: disulfide isomerase DsbC N-terminal domain-containing protein [Nitrospirota bacterium]|jgi:thiol:disulfide interchange protein DsbC
MGNRNSWKPALLLVLAALLVAGAMGIAASEKSLSTKEAEDIIRPLVSDVQVLSVKPAEVKGLWEVVLMSKGKKGIVYLDQAGKHIILGSVVEIATRENLTKQRYNEITKVDFSAIPLKDAITLGNAQAKHRVVVFDDPQ